MKPVQYAQVSYFAHFSRLFCCNFEINGYFHFFIYLFIIIIIIIIFFFFFIIFFFFWGVEGRVILEGFISGTEYFHIIYFYFHLSITQKLNLSQ